MKDLDYVCTRMTGFVCNGLLHWCSCSKRYGQRAGLCTMDRCLLFTLWLAMFNVAVTDIDCSGRSIRNELFQILSAQACIYRLINEASYFVARSAYFCVHSVWSRSGNRAVYTHCEAANNKVRYCNKKPSLKYDGSYFRFQLSDLASKSSLIPIW